MKLFGSKLFESDRTYCPKKGHKEGTQRYDLHQFSRTLLLSGDLETAATMPLGADPNHWLAMNVVEFFRLTLTVYAPLSEFCTKASCPVMSSGPRFQFYWKNPPEYPKAKKISAPEYIHLLMTWIKEQLDDECIFPQNEDNPYPPNFREIVQRIFRRLFRVFAHIYYSHLDKIHELREESHLNTIFKHFILVVWKNKLIQREEQQPLRGVLFSLMGERAREELDGPKGS